jgi:ADP-dependent phosphofructokinase/glucokinase
MGLLLAATLAAARSQKGRIDDKEDIKGGLGIDLSPRGLARLQALADHLGAGADFLTEGIASHGPYDLVFIPTKIVPKPVLTVGLGDIISSSAFIIGTMA